MLQFRWIDYEVQYRDAPADDGEAQNRDRLTPGSEERTSRTVDKHRVSGSDETRRRGEHVPGYGGGADDRRAALFAVGSYVEPEHDVGIQNVDQFLEITRAGGRQEGVDDAPLQGEIRVWLGRDEVGCGNFVIYDRGRTAVAERDVSRAMRRAPSLPVEDVRLSRAAGSPGNGR
jgi:hypothetical protein